MVAGRGRKDADLEVFKEPLEQSRDCVDVLAVQVNIVASEQGSLQSIEA